MGSLQASDMASMADLDTTLAWHLRSNHYPPVPASMIEPCKQAIDAYNEGDLDREIELPDGVLYRGDQTCPARAIITAHHLEAWLTDENCIHAYLGERYQGEEYYCLDCGADVDPEEA